MARRLTTYVREDAARRAAPSLMIVAAGTTEGLIVRHIINIIIMLLILCAVQDSWAAPAPLSKSARSWEAYGRPPTRCVMLWGANEYDAAFLPSGTYWARTKGSQDNGLSGWEGSWAVGPDGDGGRWLLINERPVGSSSSWVTYRVTLAWRWEGRIPSGGDFRLTAKTP